MYRIAILACVAWTGLVGWRAIATWPTVPLDMSRNDPATEAAFKAAELVHAGGHALIALIPLVIVLIVGQVLGRRDRRG